MVEIIDVEKKNQPLENPDVQKALYTQLSFKKKIENNTSIIKDISMGALDKERFKNLHLKIN